MNHTTALIHDLARLRRIETAARAALDAADINYTRHSWTAHNREREAMRELRRVLTEG